MELNIQLWNKENWNDILLKVILFLISPFFSFLYSLRTIKTKSSFVVFFLFSVFFGLSLTVSTNKDLHNGFDSSSYRADFEQYKYISNSDFLWDLKEYFKFDTGKADFYDQTVFYLVSRISDNYHIMFMVVASIFAFFSLKSFAFFVKEKAFVYSLSCLILAYLFMSNQIFNINNFRFWTAAWIAIYSLLNIFINKNNKFYVLLLITPFFHSGFIVIYFIILLYLISGKFTKFWSIILVVSFFASEISLEIIQNLNYEIPSFLYRKIESYTNNELVYLVNYGGSGFVWVTRIYEFLVRFFLNFLVYIFINNRKYINGNFKTKKMFHFLVILMSFVNFTMFIPSLGSRFLMLTIPLISYIWLVNFCENTKYNYILYSTIFVFSFKILMLGIYTFPNLKYYLTVTEPIFYFSSPFYLIYRYLLI